MPHPEYGHAVHRSQGPSLEVKPRPFRTTKLAHSVQNVTKPKYIGAQLKAARKLKAIPTTRALATQINQAGFGEKVIGKVERDERPAKAHEIQWLADALGMTVDDLLRDPAAAVPVDSKLEEVAKALAGFTEAIETQNKLLARQSAVLDRIEEAIDRENVAAKRDEESGRRLLEAAERAREIFQAAAETQGLAHPARTQ